MIFLAKVIDLSQLIYTDMPKFAAHPDTTIDSWTTLEKDGYQSEKVTMSPHVGSHIDAPGHFVAGGKWIDKVEIDKCFGPAICLDFTNKKENEKITREEIEAKIEEHGLELKKGDTVLFATGWDRYLDDPDKLMKYPGIDKDGAELFLEKGVKIVGSEIASIDYAPSTTFAAHDLLLKNEILIIENLVNLTDPNVLGKRFQFFGVPLKYKDGTGSQIRAFAIVD